MKLKFIIFLILINSFLLATEYQINLSWDEFEGECNGFISGSIGEEHAFLSGGGAAEALDGKLISVGEGMSTDAQQVFKINSNDGFFTFWIKDKFADDDMNSDPNLISMSKPMISVFKDGELIDLIKVLQGAGLACKVFTLDASTGEVDREIKYYPKSRIIVGSIVDAVTGDPLRDVKVSITDYMKQARQTITDETGIFVFEVEIGQYKLDISKEEYIGTFANVRMGADETLLDRDDMDKYGPETVTIYKPAVGNYKYSVHDYSNKKSKRSKKLSRSNAQVFVYGQNKLLASFKVPHNFRGNCWHVFEINEKHAIIPINKIKYVKDAVSIH